METASEGGAWRARPAAHASGRPPGGPGRAASLLQRGVLVSHGRKPQDCRPHSKVPSHALTDQKLTNLCGLRVCPTLKYLRCAWSPEVTACTHAHTGDHEKQQCG